MSGIRLKSLTKKYGAVVAVDNIDLDIAAGSFVTLLGPSGSGKTTTMRMIAGLEQPTEGDIWIGNRHVSGHGTFVPTHRRRLGMVFQSYAVWPHKTVAQNVAFPLQQQKVSKADQTRRVQRILERVGLGAMVDRYPSQLSGGQQQRVALARALVSEPDVILFDEPLSNLDAKLRDSMRGLLQDIHREFGITAVYVTHDQGEAMVLSDRVYVMNFGKIMQGGTPTELYERPRSLFVAGFVGSANTIKVHDIDHANSSVRIEGGASLRVSTLPEGEGENILVVRPHRVHFAMNGSADNVIEGVVSNAIYLGDRVRYTVVLPSGSEIVIEHGSEESRRAVGETVRLHLPVEACVVI